MSTVFSYYLAATHHIKAYPSPVDCFDELKEVIISNIPQLASNRDKERMLDAVAKEIGVSVESLKNASSHRKEERSSYQFCQNDKGEVLLIMPKRKKPIGDSPLFILDRKTRFAYLYRSHESSVLFDDLTMAVNEAIRNVGEILVAETDELAGDVVEYTAVVRVVKDVRDLFDNPVYLDEKDLLVNIEARKREEYELARKAGYANTVFEAGNLFIIYEGERVDDSKGMYVYENSGQGFLFLNEKLTLVPEPIDSATVARLDLRGKVYVCYGDYQGLPVKETDSHLDIESFTENIDIIPDNVSEVSSHHVPSVLLFLSKFLNSTGNGE